MEPRHFTDLALASSSLARNSWCERKVTPEPASSRLSQGSTCDQELERQGKDTLALLPKPSGAWGHPNTLKAVVLEATWIIY